MKVFITLGFCIIMMGSAKAQRGIEIEGGLGLPGGDLEAFYKNQPHYSISVTNT